MGFGNVASALILIIASMSIATGVVVSLKDHFDSATSSVALVQAEATKEIKTSVNIDIVKFDNITNTTNVFVKNSGNQKLDIDKVDVYMDKMYIPRNGTNRTIGILADTSVIDDSIWDPKEVIYIYVYNFSLSTSQVHEIKVTTQYDGNDIYEFTV